MPFVAINPATEEIIAEYPVLDATGIDRALESAHGAYLKWRGASFAERATYMTRAAELLEGEIPVVAELMTSEMGKTFAAAKGEAMKCAATMRYFAEHAEAMLQAEDIPTKGSRSGLRYEPTGAIFAVMPWNFPLWQVVRMAVPTIMAGNVVVFKHAPNVPGCARYLEDLFLRAGFPAGVLTTVFVEIDQVPSIIADPRIVGVTLTGIGSRGPFDRRRGGQELKEVRPRTGGIGPLRRRLVGRYGSHRLPWRSRLASKTTVRPASPPSASSWCARGPMSSSIATPRPWARFASATRWTPPPSSAHSSRRRSEN